MSQENFNPSGLTGFDNPNFDEDVLFEDFYLRQEPFAPENPVDFGTLQEQNRDELFEAIEDLANEEVYPSPQVEEHREPNSQADPEEPDILQTLNALDALVLPTKDNNPESDFQSPENVGAAQHQEQLLPVDTLSPNNVILSMTGEERLVPNSRPTKLHDLSPAEIQMREGPSMVHGSQASFATSTALPQSQEMQVAPAGDDTALTRMHSERKRRFHTEVEGGGISYTRERPLDICEGTFTPGIFPDILDPTSLERSPTHLTGYPINNTQIQSPKRQRKAGIPRSTFSQPAQKSLKRAFDQLEIANRAQGSTEGSERPKKRTRTRIEDMDPSMVHVCNFPGCTKKFAKKYNLKIHQRRHNGDLPFLCEYTGCAKRFMWLSSFSRHLRVHEARRNGGRRRREAQVESEGVQQNDASSEREPDIAISENFSILNVSDVKHLIEHELSEEVTFACAVTALDSKPCESLISAAKINQTERQKLLSAGRAEELYQQQAMPYGMKNPHLQTFCQLLAVTANPSGMIDDSNPTL